MSIGLPEVGALVILATIVVHLSLLSRVSAKLDITNQILTDLVRRMDASRRG